jgi:hypothetical protein
LAAVAVVAPQALEQMDQ